MDDEFGEADENVITDPLEYSQKTSSLDEMRPCDFFGEQNYKSLQERISNITLAKQSTPSDTVGKRTSNPQMSSRQGSSEDPLRKQLCASERVMAAEKVLAGHLANYTSTLRQIEQLREQNEKLTAAVEMYEDKEAKSSEIIREKEDYIKALEA